MADRAFVQEVQECLKLLHDRVSLERHSLARRLAAGPGAGEALRRLLLQTIARLKPAQTAPAGASSPAWRRYHLLVLHYEQGLTLQEAARALGISLRQASRDHQQALQALADLLWDHLAHRPASLASVHSPPARPAAVPTESLDTLETELRYATASPDDRSTDLGPAVRSVAATMAGLLSEHRVTLESQIPDTLPPVAVSRPLLRQGLINLLGYLVEARPGAHVTLAAADTSQGVVLTITARRGRGRPPVIHPSPPQHLLAMFQAGCELLAAQGGRVEQAEAADRSLTLEVLLPPVSTHTILLIDDNPDVVALFRRYLKGKPYRLLQASTPQRALQLATELRPHLIILDLLLPSLDGWELLQHLRALPATRETPVIVCSVLPEHELARSLGVVGFLQKPVTPTGLLTVLERHLPGASAARPDRPADI